MAQTVQTGQVTPADELRELLAIAEKRVANVWGSGESAVALLKELDRIAGSGPCSRRRARICDRRLGVGRRSRHR